MSIDLSGIQEFIEENLFDDEVTVKRNTDLTEDEVWDPNTLTYSGGDPDTEVWAGNGYITADKSQPTLRDQGGAETALSWYFLNVPLGTPDFLSGDLVTVTAAERGSEIVGQEFVIQGDEVGTFKVKRRWRMQRVTRTAHT